MFAGGLPECFLLQIDRSMAFLPANNKKGAADPSIHYVGGAGAVVHVIARDKKHEEKILHVLSLIKLANGEPG